MASCMKIALVSDKFSTGGGLEHMYQLCRGMPSIHFGVFGDDGDGKRKFLALPNVTVFDQGYRSADIERFAPDVVHFHHLRPLLAWRGKAPKTVFTVHGVHLHQYEFRSGWRAALQRRLRLTLEKFLYGRIDRLITVSHEDAAFLREHYGIASTTIYNGLDFKPIQAEACAKSSLRTELGLAPEQRLVLTVGRFDFPKGYDVLIEAIALLKDRSAVGEQVFVFAGDGATLPAMRALAMQRGVAEHIRFLGRRSDVYRLLKGADLLVMPSRWEGLPLSLVEALVAGLPVIASNTYGIATVQREVGSNVCLVANEDSDALATALTRHYTFEPCVLDAFRLEPMIAATSRVYSDA